MKQKFRNILKIAVVYFGSTVLYFTLGLSPKSAAFSGTALLAFVAITIATAIAIVTVVHSGDEKVIKQIEAYRTSKTKQEVADALHHFKAFTREIKEDATLTIVGSVLCLALYVLLGTSLPIAPDFILISTQEIICIAILGTVINILLAFIDSTLSFVRMLDFTSVYKNI